MSRIFTDGAARCMNASCQQYLRVWIPEEIKLNEWLKRGRCPGCHRKVRRKQHWRADTRNIETNTGEVKRRGEMDSLPLVFAIAAGRKRAK